MSRDSSSSSSSWRSSSVSTVGRATRGTSVFTSRSSQSATSVEASDSQQEAVIAFPINTKYVNPYKNKSKKTEHKRTETPEDKIVTAMMVRYGFREVQPVVVAELGSLVIGFENEHDAKRFVESLASELQQLNSAVLKRFIGVSPRNYKRKQDEAHPVEQFSYAVTIPPICVDVYLRKVLKFDGDRLGRFPQLVSRDIRNLQYAWSNGTFDKITAGDGHSDIKYKDSFREDQKIERVHDFKSMISVIESVLEREDSISNFQLFHNTEDAKFALSQAIKSYMGTESITAKGYQNFIRNGLFSNEMARILIKEALHRILGEAIDHEYFRLETMLEELGKTLSENPENLASAINKVKEKLAEHHYSPQAAALIDQLLVNAIPGWEAGNVRDRTEVIEKLAVYQNSQSLAVRTAQLIQAIKAGNGANYQTYLGWVISSSANSSKQECAECAENLAKHIKGFKALLPEGTLADRLHAYNEDRTTRFNRFLSILAEINQSEDDLQKAFRIHSLLSETDLIPAVEKSKLVSCTSFVELVNQLVQERDRNQSLLSKMSTARDRLLNNFAEANHNSLFRPSKVYLEPFLNTAKQKLEDLKVQPEDENELCFYNLLRLDIINREANLALIENLGNFESAEQLREHFVLLNEKAQTYETFNQRYQVALAQKMEETLRTVLDRRIENEHTKSMLSLIGASFLLVKYADNIKLDDKFFNELKNGSTDEEGKKISKGTLDYITEYKLVLAPNILSPYEYAFAFIELSPENIRDDQRIQSQFNNTSIKRYDVDDFIQAIIVKSLNLSLDNVIVHNRVMYVNSEHTGWQTMTLDDQKRVFNEIVGNAASGLIESSQLMEAINQMRSLRDLVKRKRQQYENSTQEEINAIIGGHELESSASLVSSSSSSSSSFVLPSASTLSVGSSSRVVRSSVPTLSSDPMGYLMNKAEKVLIKGQGSGLDTTKASPEEQQTLQILYIESVYRNPGIGEEGLEGLIARALISKCNPRMSEEAVAPRPLRNNEYYLKERPSVEIKNGGLLLSFSSLRVRDRLFNTLKVIGYKGIMPFQKENDHVLLLSPATAAKFLTEFLSFNKQVLGELHSSVSFEGYEIAPIKQVLMRAIVGQAHSGIQAEYALVVSKTIEEQFDKIIRKYCTLPSQEHEPKRSRTISRQFSKLISKSDMNESSEKSVPCLSPEMTQMIASHLIGKLISHPERQERVLDQFWENVHTQGLSRGTSSHVSRLKDKGELMQDFRS